MQKYSVDLSDDIRARRILVVEDDQEESQLIQKILRDLWPGCLLTACKSLSEGLKACQNNVFTLILLELNLPDSVGPSTVQDMREVNETAPIIVIAEFCTDMTEQEALKNGASEVIKKSFLSTDRFKRALRKHGKLHSAS